MFGPTLAAHGDPFSFFLQKQSISSERTKKEEAENVRNWRRISEALDKLCLVVYLTVTCGLIIWVAIAANN